MPKAIDLFCGAGGFSEGLLQAGFDILFSSDKSPMVRDTYMNRHKQLGLIQEINTHFELADINDLTGEFIFDKINSLKVASKKIGIQDIDAIFGGPPCQGFSRAGKRDASDPRNMLFHEYLRIVSEIKPKYVVMENVVGLLDMQMLDFPSVLSSSKLYKGQNLVSSILEKEFRGLGYTMLKPQILNAYDFGVPQQRKRVIFLAYRSDVHPLRYPETTNDYFTVGDALELLVHEGQGKNTYAANSILGRTPNITINKPLKNSKLTNMDTSVHSASIIERFSLYEFGENRNSVLSRLRTTGINLFEKSPSLFYETLYQVNFNSNKTAVSETLEALELNTDIKLTNLCLNHIFKVLSKIDMESNFKNINIDLLTELSRKLKCNDRKATLSFLEQIKSKLNFTICKEDLHDLLINGEISNEIADALLTKKGMRIRLDPNKPSPTIITLPDDFIHPYENRCLTVREMARLQSFDDSFEFLGKRTTGGQMRAKETPQFTQVGNAVPPLLAFAVAREVRRAINKNILIKNHA